MEKYVFTCGDINGIGPEICVKTFQHLLPSKNYRFIFVSPSNVFIDAYELVKPNFEFNIVKKLSSNFSAEYPVTVVDIGKPKLKPGTPTKTSGSIAYKSIVNAFHIVDDKNADALITAPISKYAFKKAGINFPGHTELLADLCSVKNFVMTFLSDSYLTALATIHEPIKNISKKITKTKIKNTVQSVHKFLTDDLGIVDPKIALLGLNPHAGESGEIGKEEVEIIAPAIRELESINAAGPFVPDAFFGNKIYKDFDLTIGMYHDQVLIPFKLMNFNSGVNYTAGLPIVRTSPDHGTAFDIAWRNKADYKSMMQAFRWARKIVKKRKKIEH